MDIKTLLYELDWYIGEALENVEYFYEQASGRGDARKRIEALGENLCDHLAKILYLKHVMPETVHHWCAEIQAPLNWIIKKDFKGGKLTSKTLQQWLNDGITTNTKKIRNTVANDEKTDKCKPLEPQDYETLKDQLKQLCDLTIEHKQQDTYIKIEEIEKIVMS